MKKFFSYSLFLLLSLLIFLSVGNANIALSNDAFKTNISVDYKLKESGATSINHNVVLINQLSDVYATSYSLVVGGINPINPKAYQDGRELKVVKTEEAGIITLKVQFDEAAVGLGKRRVFSIVFEDDSLAVKTGEIWEVLIPKIDNNSSFESYDINLFVPQSFGKLAYMSPDANGQSQQSNYDVYHFNREAVSKQSISAAFGNFQVFVFDITYHLENPLTKRSSIEIAIPPDTAFQKVNYTKLDPKPESVGVDRDGNWIAKYILSPRQRLDVKSQGAVQIFSEGRELPFLDSSVADKNLGETDVWQTRDPVVTNIAKDLKTPKQIYDYVTSNFNYNYDRVKPNVTRLGAKEALLNPNLSICMEFTDAFIALARSSGIPAREVNGYAYTENPQLQPLSLVADVLHSWPEYWDANRKIWVPVDPTWGQTSGIDFFNKLDLRHFTFVIHGADSTKPYPPGSYKLGTNPQKDVFVSFGELPEKRVIKPVITAKTKGGLFFSEMSLLVDIKNDGPTAIYELPIDIYFDSTKKEVKTSNVILPYGKYSFKVSIPYSFLGSKTPNKITIKADTKELSVPTHRVNIIISNLCAILISIFLIVFLLYKKLNEKIKNIKNNSIKSS